MFHLRVGVRFALVGLLVVGVLALVGCASQPQPTAAVPNQSQAANAPAAKTEPVNLRFTVWSGNEAHLALLNGIADEYRKTNPNVTVKYDVIPVSDYVSKITVQLAGGSPPDAGWILERTAPTFVSAGVLVDLAPTVKAKADYNLADFSQPALGLWTKGDAVYGIPFSTSPFFVFYNEDMFKAAGVETPQQLLAKNQWTWENLAKSAKAVLKGAPQGTYGFATEDGGIYTQTGSFQNIVPILRAYGGEAWNPEGTKCLLDTPESVAAIKLYHDMVYVDKSAPPPGQQADYYAGTAAMTIGQLSRVARLKDAKFKWDVVPLPAGPKSQPYVIGQAAIGVFNASKNKEVAKDFVAFMTSKDNVAKLAQFFPPARVSVLEGDALLKANPQVPADRMKQVVVEGIKQGAVLTAHPDFPKIELTAQPEFDKLWKAGVDVQATMTGMCKALAPLLK